MGARAGGATAAPVFHVAWAVVVTVGIAASLAVTTVWRRRLRSRPADSHGSAHWGDGANLRGEQGLLLGRERQRLLRFSGEGHVLTVAPTRAGKGVSAVIPNLLDYPGSVLVTDPKGENYAVTATWREALGHTVHAFDPFGVVQGEARYNPLDLIDAASVEAVDDARLLADMLVLPGAREGEQAFWNEEARGVLLEARRDAGRGNVVTVLVQSGTLAVGDVFFAGSVFGRVRSMHDDHGAKVAVAGPATPVEVTGLDEIL